MGSECFNCQAETNDDLFCHGCRNYVCDNCDKNDSLVGAHSREDHLEDPAEDA